MGRQMVVGLYVVAMVAVIVGVDIAFFRSRFWERLMANIGMVLVFGALLPAILCGSREQIERAQRLQAGVQPIDSVFGGNPAYDRVPVASLHCPCINHRRPG